MSAPATIDDYISGFPAEVQPILQEVRRTLREATPGAVEAISYGIPTFKLDGRYLVYFAGWKRHISVYPVPDADDKLRAELAPYIAAKGTLKFPLDQPIPYDLIGRVTAQLLVSRVAPG